MRALGNQIRQIARWSAYSLIGPTLLAAQVCSAQELVETVPIERYAENPKTEPKPCDQVYYTQHQVLDKTRETMEELVCRMALWMDGVGSQNHGNVLAARRSHGRLETSYYWSEFSGGDFRVRAKIRVELPVLKRRLSAFIGLDNEDEFVKGRSETFALRSEFPSLNEDDDWLAGLGYRLPGSSRVFRSEFRIGAKRLTNTKVFAQNRFNWLIYSDDNDLWSLREILFWTNRDGFGATTGSDWMHILSDKLLFRWDNVATVSQETSGVSWRTAAWFYRSVQPLGAGVAIEAFSRGETKAPVPVREYGLRTLYRHPLFERRLFIELVNGYSWPKLVPGSVREGSFGVGVNLHLPFGPQT